MNVIEITAAAIALGFILLAVLVYISDSIAAWKNFPIYPDLYNSVMIASNFIIILALMGTFIWFALNMR